MTYDLSGKTALITGASSGLGAHFAKVLARQGASVTLAARRVEALHRVCEDIKAIGATATAVQMDVTDPRSVERVFEPASAGFDIVVNNAGISIPAPALEITEAAWDAVIGTNLKGVFLVAQMAARRMVSEGRPGSIVNIASALGLRVAGSVASYAASKAGVIQLTKAMALEWARYGIRVNALCPGYIETDINRDFFTTEAGRALITRIPQRRLGKAEELEGPLLLFCSDAGSYLTGATLAVDGGHLVSSL